MDTTLTREALEQLRIALEDFDSKESLGPTTEAVISAAQKWYLARPSALATVVQPQPAIPIDMVLHCPACGMQHIDAVETLNVGPDERGRRTPSAVTWSNPPHRSHLCHGCGHIWRPADVPTNGVECVKTRGKEDSAAASPAPILVGEVPRVPDYVLTCVHAYGDARADDDGTSPDRLGEAIRAMRQWAATLASPPPDPAPGLPLRHLPVHRTIVEELEVVGVRCADSAKCHHECKTECARKDGCVPLSIASSFLNDDWSVRSIGLPGAAEGSSHG
jgi:hypothetical protein